MALVKDRGRRSKRLRHPEHLHEGGFLKGHNPTAWMHAFRCNNVYITKYQSMKVPVLFRTRYAMADKRILVDSGATDNFIHPKFVKCLRVGMQDLERPMKIWNIDGTTN